MKFRGNNTVKNHGKFPWKKLLFIVVGILIVTIIGGVLFIKLDPGGAGIFTDQILRPALGDTQVISLEKVFFNTSDAINQIEYKAIDPSNPFAASSSAALSPNDPAVGSSALVLSPISPITTSTSITGEGQWRAIPLTILPNQIVLADTFIRPDPSRSYAFVALVQMDMSRLNLWSVAGTQEPGGKVGKPGPGIIPKTAHDQGNLVAAFDGGFQYRDGQYGMIVGKKTYLPLKNDLATLVAHTDGRVEIVKYEGQNLGSDIVFVRQNCPMLIENGVIGTQSETNKNPWGRTITSDIYTWRSGIGITAKGNLIFAAGNALVPSTLAAALKAAGAVNAMQLDINPYWVRFNIFDNYQNGSYAHSIIMKGISDGSYSYLHGYQKDFFYITKK